MDRLWTIDDVAVYLRVKPATVKYWIYNSNLPYVRLGKFYRFRKEDVERWVENNEKKVNVVHKYI